MDLVGELRRLTFGEALTTFLVVVGLGLTGVAVYRQIQTDNRLKAAERRAGRAIITLQRSPDTRRGAAIQLGRSETVTPPIGQHFTGAIRNTGPHLAERIHVTADLGGLAANVIKAPASLPPYSPLEELDLLIPFGTSSFDDVMALIRAERPLRIRIDFTDGTQAFEPVWECFVFRLQEVDSSKGTDWVSSRENCP